MSGDTVEKLPLSSVQEKSSSKSQETNEIDLIDNSDSNFVVRGSSEGEDIEISFTHSEDNSDISISELRKQLRELQRKPIQDVTHEIDDKRGRIAIESINIPESSDSRNLREITIQGKFLPWPKHYTSNRPKIYEILDSSISSSLLTEKTFSFDLSLDSGNFEIVNRQSGQISSKSSVSSSLQQKLAFSGYGGQVVLKTKKILSKNQDFVLDNTGSVSTKKSFTVDSEYSLESGGTGNFILSVISTDFTLENNNSGQVSFKNSLSSNITPTLVFTKYGENYGKSYGEGEGPKLKTKKILSKSQNFVLEGSAESSVKRGLSVDSEYILNSNVVSNFILSLDSGTISLKNKNSGKASFKKSLSSSITPTLAFTEYGQDYGDNYGQGEESVLSIK